MVITGYPFSGAKLKAADLKKPKATVQEVEPMARPDTSRLKDSPERCRRLFFD